MTHRNRCVQHDDARNPMPRLHPSPELWGARDPTDLTLRVSLCADEGWYEAHWYGDRAEPGPGLLRFAFRGLRSGAAAARRAVASMALRGPLAAPGAHGTGPISAA